MKASSAYALLFLAAVAFSLGSCRIQRRIHRPGVHIVWNTNKRAAKYAPSTDIQIKKTTPIHTEQNDSYHEPNKESQDLILKPLEEPFYVTRTSQRYVDSEIIQEDTHVGSSSRVEQANKTIQQKFSTPSNEPMGPPKIPVSAYIFLALGFSLLGAGLLITIVFWVSTSSLIGLPIPVIIMLVAGVGFLVFAYNRAINSFYRDDSNKQNDNQHREKEPREPIKKGDKIFIGIAIAIVLGVILAIAAA